MEHPEPPLLQRSWFWSWVVQDLQPCLGISARLQPVDYFQNVYSFCRFDSNPLHQFQPSKDLFISAAGFHLLVRQRSRRLRPYQLTLRASPDRYHQRALLGSLLSCHLRHSRQKRSFSSQDLFCPFSLSMHPHLLRLFWQVAAILRPSS